MKVEIRNVAVYYFAYGSNMSEKRMIDRGLTPLDKQVAILDDFKFIINKKSYKNPNMGFANVMESPSSFVEGILYRVYERDIIKLDKFEGYPKHYTREKLIVRLKDNTKVTAIVYIANPNWVSPKELSTTLEYKNFILEGKDFISETYYQILTENIKNNG